MSETLEIRTPLLRVPAEEITLHDIMQETDFMFWANQEDEIVNDDVTLKCIEAMHGLGPEQMATVSKILYDAIWALPGVSLSLGLQQAGVPPLAHDQITVSPRANITPALRAGHIRYGLANWLMDPSRERSYTYDSQSVSPAFDHLYRKWLVAQGEAQGLSRLIAARAIDVYLEDADVREVSSDELDEYAKHRKRGGTLESYLQEVRAPQHIGTQRIAACFDHRDGLRIDNPDNLSDQEILAEVKEDYRDNIFYFRALETAYITRFLGKIPTFYLCCAQHDSGV